MNEININIDLFQGKRILITPLNWGLGHATRCIPIVNLFLEYQVEIFIASDGEALELLKNQFPKITCIELPPYGIRYPYKSMELNMAIQTPKFINAIRREQHEIKEIVLKYNIDVIISDNRYGCRSENCHSIFMTHQVNLKGATIFSEWVANRINHVMVNKFDELWIPDFKGDKSLAGVLSQVGTRFSSIPIHYIKAVSRFKQYSVAIKRDILVILSGPEPARTKLEHLIYDLLKNMHYAALIVRGTNMNKHKRIEGAIKMANLMNADDLNREILASKIVICRSGYTSIMDLYKLKKQAILIPTVGQPEQEYLANYHKDKDIFKVWKMEDDIEDLKIIITQLLENKERI